MSYCSKFQFYVNNYDLRLNRYPFIPVNSMWQATVHSICKLIRKYAMQMSFPGDSPVFRLRGELFDSHYDFDSPLALCNVVHNFRPRAIKRQQIILHE